MDSKAKLFGHPIHPMLIVFPLGLLTMGVVFDVIRYYTGNDSFAVAAYYNIIAGIIGGVVAGVFGLIDWVAIPRATRAREIGLWHGFGNLVLIALFAASWYIRRNEPGHIPTPAAFVMAVVAIVLGCVTGWLGGEMVDRLGVGVDEGANLNAPSSLKRHATPHQPMGRL